jgi:hypothetical protein
MLHVAAFPGIGVQACLSLQRLYLQGSNSISVVKMLLRAAKVFLHAHKSPR